MKCKYCDKEAKGISLNTNSYLCEDHTVRMSEIIFPKREPDPPIPPDPPKQDSEDTSEGGGHHPWPWPWPWWTSEGK